MQKESYYSQSFSFRSISSIEKWGTEDSGLILSDYNKGILNSKLNLSTLSFTPLRYLVADTKYRTLNLEYLKLAKKTFWRCTDSEYESGYASNFDYTIWTNAKKPIIVLNKSQEILFVVDYIPIEDDMVVDTCGAGDTFTAAFASYLFDSKQISQLTIKEAVLFSLSCCQEVIQVDKTSITSKKIHNFKEKFI